MAEQPKAGEGPKRSDALGTLRARSHASRAVGIAVALAGIIIAAVILGMIWRTVTGGTRNIPYIPSPASV